MFAQLKKLFNFASYKPTNMKKRENISATIKSLKRGEAVNFDLARYDYVVNCRSRIALSTGRKFTSKINRDENTVTITRNH